MTATFETGILRPDTTERQCLRCKRPMVTRRRHAELGGVRGDGTPLVKHASHGYCRGCIDRVNHRSQKKEERESEVQYRRDEWAFLKSCGVTIHEAARQLGVAVRTLEEYGL